MKKLFAYLLAAAVLFGTCPAEIHSARAAGGVTITKNPDDWQVVENFGYDTPLWTDNSAKLYRHSASVTNCADLLLGATLIQTKDKDKTNWAHGVPENEAYAAFTLERSADVYVAVRASTWKKGVSPPEYEPLELSDNYLPWLRENTTADFGGYEKVKKLDGTPAVVHLDDALHMNLYRKRIEVPAGQKVEVPLGGKARGEDSQLANKMYTVFIVYDYAVKEWPVWKKYPSNVNYSDKMRMRFRPVDNYTCEQNPPDFSWWKVKEADCYDLIVCRDEELTDIAYQKTGLTESFYNFDRPFSPGIYYWSVRFYSGFPEIKSAWQPARRFLIEDDAFEFPVADVAGQVTAFKAQGHPRYYPGNSDLAAFRDKVMKNQFAFYLSMYNELTKVMRDPTDMDTSLVYSFQNGVGLTNPFWKQIYYNGFDRLDPATFVYILDPNSSYNGTQVSDYAKKKLMKLTEFHLPAYDENTDSYLCTYAMKLAVYYDCLADVLSQEEKEIVFAKIGEIYEKADKALFRNDIFHENPYASHEWNCGKHLLTAALLTAGEVEAAEGRRSSEEIANTLLPYYINQTSPYQIEDGSFSGGIGYFRFQNADLEHLLFRGGIVNMWNKANFENQLYYHLYMYPTGSVGAFGDGAYYKVNEQYPYSSIIYSRLLNAHKNPIAKWALDGLPEKVPAEPETVYYDDNSKIEGKAPDTLPKAKYFKDTGYAGLHSDLADPERISLFFRSSWYGSYGHGHSDQNSFVIQAYGERLAIDSGYYPYYMSNHHKNYTIQTYAHNAITFDGGKGQSNQDMEGEGKVTGFLTHSDFDYVAGDATMAYKTARGDSPNTLGKVKRHILYLRPDVFVVIDDLEALPGDQVSFEYWLQSEKPIHTYTDSTVRIENGEAVLDAAVQYPESTSSQVLEGFRDLNGNEYPKEKDSTVTGELDPNAQEHSRIVFQTPKTDRTKMVTTLSVHKSGESAKEIIRKEYADYIQLSFADGTTVYINKGDSEVRVEDRNISFQGAALAVKGDTIMLAEGTSLRMDGISRIASGSVPVSVASGNGELSVSNLDSDTEVSVYYPGVTGLTSVKDEKTRELSDRIPRNGILWKREPDYIDLELYNGQYLLKVDASAPAESGEVFQFVRYYPAGDGANISFGKVSPAADARLAEYGMLCHPTNSLPEYDTPGVIVLPAKSCSLRGQFGVQLIDKVSLLGAQYYMRAYAVFRRDGELQPPVYASEGILVRQ